MIGLLAAALLAGSWSVDAPADTTERAKQNLEQSVRVTSEVQYSLGQQQFSCSIPDRTGLSASLKRSNADAVALNRLRLGRQDAGTKYLATKELAQVAAFNSRAQLAVADWLKKHGCLNEADEMYRDLYQSYDERDFPEIIKKAQLGIDDVRFARLKAN